MLRELERFYADYCKSICEEADILRAEEMPAITEELFAIYENTGNRLIYEDVYFKRRKFLAVFGLKVILDQWERDERIGASEAAGTSEAIGASEEAGTNEAPGVNESVCVKDRNIAKLEEILRDICREECWALPPHVNRKEDKEWRICVDLFAAETAQTLSEITFLLKDVLSKETVETVRQEVLRRVLIPFSVSEAPYGTWEYGESNWCAVCGGSVGSAAIYMLGDKPEELEKLLERICYSLETYYLKSFAEDGTCLEGLGYFTYGMTYFTGFAAQLYEFTAGKRDLFRREKLAKIAAFQSKCYFQSGKTVSFADGFTDDTFRPGLTCYLAMKYPKAEIPSMEKAAGLNDDTCYRWMGLYRNLTWTKEYIDALRQRQVPEAAGQEKRMAGGQVVLPDAQWTICQSVNGAGMAAKGGHNGEPHNHNDVGSFFYLNGEDFLLTDLGCGEYTRDYFSARRYDYLCCRSLGHNVPVIDGKEQSAGKEYGCDRFETDGQGRTVISFAGAYGNPELKSLIRTLEWNRENGTLQVEDCFERTDRLHSIRENLITGWKPEVQGNNIRIRGAYKNCEVVIEGENVKVDTISRDFSDHEGIHRNIWLIQWEVPVGKTAGETTARFSIRNL